MPRCVVLRAQVLRVLAVTAIAAMTVSCSAGAEESTAATGHEADQKPDFTHVTVQMFVDRSVVPNGSTMDFTAPTIDSGVQGPGDPVEPPECGPIFWGPRPVQVGSATWSSTRTNDTSANNDHRVFSLFLAVPAERPDLRALLGRCGTVEYDGVRVTIAPLSLAGLPSWSTATRITNQGATGLGVIGLYRGLYVSVAFTQLPAGDMSPNDVDALVELFNGQVVKLAGL